MHNYIIKVKWLQWLNDRNSGSQPTGSVAHFDRTGGSIYPGILNNPFGPLLAALIGVPAYASSISAIPIVRGLMDLGMDKGTALSFMVGGAATSIPAMVAVYSIVKRRTFILYITFSMAGAIVSGYIFRLF